MAKKELGHIVVEKDIWLMVFRYPEDDVGVSNPEARIAKVVEIGEKGVKVVYEKGEDRTEALLPVLQVTNKGRLGWIRGSFGDEEGANVIVRGASKLEILGFKLRRRGWNDESVG